ncbi:hypothetical protein KCU61_g6571, partial [Aureobasidium melanogenum]
MLNVTDSVETKNKGLDAIPAGKITSAEKDKQIWGPKLSKTSDICISGASWGIPADASIAFSFSNSSSEGAMLLTSPHVSVQRLLYESTYKDWAKKNACALFTLYPDAKKNGFYIVTSTYNTRRCATVAWSDPNKQVVLGFKADVAGFGELAPSTEWYIAKQSDGVNYFEAQDDGEKTVFFGGIFFEVRSIRITGHEVRAVNQSQWKGRSGGTPNSFQLHDGYSNETMEIEMIDVPEKKLSEVKPELDEF